MSLENVKKEFKFIGWQIITKFIQKLYMNNQSLRSF